MSGFSHGKQQFAAVGAAAAADDTGVIDLAGESDTENDDSNREEDVDDVVVVEPSAAKKRRLDPAEQRPAAGPEVVDLVDDDDDDDVPASARVCSLPSIPITEGDPWFRVDLDIWGPTVLENRNDDGDDDPIVVVHVLIAIDPATGWLELASLEGEPTLEEIDRELHAAWLSRYPRPAEIGFRSSGEHADRFRTLCETLGCRPSGSSSSDDGGASNNDRRRESVLKRVRKALGDSHRTFRPPGESDGLVDATRRAAFEGFLAAAASSIRSSVDPTASGAIRSAAVGDPTTPGDHGSPFNFGGDDDSSDGPSVLGRGGPFMEISDDFGGSRKGINTKRPRTASSCSDGDVDANHPAKTAAASGFETIDLVDSSDDDDDESGTEHRGTSAGESASGDRASRPTDPANHQVTQQRLILESDDDAVMTDGLLERMHAASTANGNRCWMCVSSSNGSAGGAAVGRPRHIHQKDNWSCGYRNFQMVLSALLPRLADRPEHAVFRTIPRRRSPTPIALPSLRRIQARVEEAWSEGFDPDGAEHYRSGLAGKTGRAAFLGAVEIVNLFWYHWIDAVVIQYVRCNESRILLPYGLLAYFGRSSMTTTTGVVVGPSAAAALVARTMLSEGERLSKSATSIESLMKAAMISNESEAPTNSPLPIYLQWEGHSVTVVGVEIVGGAEGRKESSSPFSPRSFNLLVFDPLGRHADRPTPSPRGDLLPAKARLPWERISRKDLQIVVCTEASMSYSERLSCRGEGGGGGGRLPRERVMTAAEAAVHARLLSGRR